MACFYVLLRMHTNITKGKSITDAIIVNEQKKPKCEHRKGFK